MAGVGFQEKERVIISDEVGDVGLRRSRRSIEKEDEEILVEETFKNVEVPSWRNQITVRAIVTSFLLSIIFNFMVCKLNLTTGVIPSFNVAAGLLGFVALKSWTALLNKFGLLKQPFTRQENTVIQTCVVASSGIAFSSGTGNYLLGMSSRIAAQADEGNMPINVKNLSLGWMIGFLFAVSFVGLFSILPLRKIMIQKQKLQYPSGTATALLINGLHTPTGSQLATKQVAQLFKSAGLSFVFAFFQWFFASGDGCGFSNFPTFGLKAYQQRFYFDFSFTYIGVGMLCPYIVNVSLLIGAIMSWGIMWPLIEKQKGHWYDANLSASSLHGIQGYRVFIAIAMILGDGAFHIIYMLVQTIRDIVAEHRSSVADHDNSGSSESRVDHIESFDQKQRSEFFSKDEIPTPAAIIGYISLAALSIVVVPFIFHPLKWYHILVAYVVAPLLAFCNAYGCGLTDWSLASSYGKIAIMIFSSWVGLEHGGIVAGLAACGVMMSIVSTASDLMQDFKTGYLTLASPRSMFFGQVAGTAMGCLMSPLVFWIFYKAYPIGDPGSSYPAPYGLLYRGIALLGVEGLSALPKHCLTLAIVFFFAAIVINTIKEVLKHYETKYEIHRYIPSPMCMAIPFYLGGYFCISMCIGSLVNLIWKKKNIQNAKDFGPAVASGLICGESLWGIPAAILSLAGVGAPICMKFLSASTNNRVNDFLSGH